MRKIRFQILLLFLPFFILIGQEKDTTKTDEKKVEFLDINKLRKQLDFTFDDPNFSDAFFGVLVQSLETGEIIYDMNIHKLFIPASNIKLFTTASALLLLGSNYVYQTDIFYDGYIVNNTLSGDIIVRGSGDPTLSDRFYKDNITKIFEDWADSLIKNGINNIDGNIIGDDNCFDDVGYGKGWVFEYENSWFSAPSGALCFNDNTIRITIKPTIVNAPAIFNIEPISDYLPIINKVITVDSKAEEKIQIYRDRISNIVTIYGTIKESTPFLFEHIPVINPTNYFVSVLKSVFEKKGIFISGYANDIDFEDKIFNYEEMIFLFTHKSNSLKEIVSETNKNSNNFYAEQLIRTLGWELYNFGSLDNGIKACEEVFEIMAINPENLYFADGSGLSRLNLVTPRQIVNLLSFMYKSDEFKSFYESLPIAGFDGGLAYRMKDTRAEKNVRAKPGYLIGVVALSGYINTANGEPLVFSIIINNYLLPAVFANYIQDAVCISLANLYRAY
ncbi:MAG: D-alanyl-D-alanine carboxypeptidase/D-alanyl-D-alanine-endopeptidase [Ignavibacteriales bacterium]|nr:D-alanyl-D-alanine carboxypeptidase/D-alanyl-D-alanine-endopeptidase [Ignavibacteriales bacterium]